MRTFFATVLTAILMTALTAAQAGQYRNFRTAIYVTVASTKQLADPAAFARQYGRMSRQLKFDKVYVEVYRNRLFATDAEIEAVKKEFAAKGVAVVGGITLAAGGHDGQFGTFDYEDPADRAECRKAVELAARHFGEVILDDFFFYNTKSVADIAAKGPRSWTQYRLDKMREVARNLVLGPAKMVNPAVKMIIKYPNWYEHFQGLGYDLDQEAQMFDGIYTGTETRDPVITDQLLQQYESYGIIRYFDNIRPGGNGGGWVDTYGVRYVDRYAEQLWDTLFAKAPQIMLFNWHDLVEETAVAPGDRPWRGLPTGFSWAAMQKHYRSSGKGNPGPGWASVAGTALESVDKVLGELGKPIGLISYKPYQSDGEDFLQNYLGNAGIPIEMTPVFPAGGQTVLLTEEAKYDPAIVAKIEKHLEGGGDVVITSGLLRALQDKGLRDVVEWEDTGRVMAVRDYYSGFGAGGGTQLNDPKYPKPLPFPEIRFYTNDSWPILRSVAEAKGDPIVLMNRYGKGVIYLLNIPENQADLYELPQGVLTQIKAYLLRDFPVRLDAPDRVALFAYDNDTLVTESYRPGVTAAKIVVPGTGARLRDLVTGKLVAAEKLPPLDPKLEGKTVFPVSLEPHSWRVFKIER